MVLIYRPIKNLGQNVSVILRYLNQGVNRPIVRSNKNIPKPVKVEKGKTYKWCTCGQSAKQPFCDGAHRGSGFVPLRWTAPETKSVLFCRCKNTCDPPFCDMSHFKVLRGNMLSNFKSPKLEDSKDKPLVAERLPSYQALEAGKTYLWCNCGRSTNQPFCDGSHVCTNLKPLSFVPEKTKPRWLCMCKQTKNAPFCDATHLEIEIQTAKEGTSI